MKISHAISLLSISAALAFSCGQGAKREENDSQKTAEEASEANDDKFQTHDAEADAAFVADAVAANYADVELASLAAQRSDNPEVKTIAKAVEHEHHQLLEDLQKLAGNKAISVPAEKNDASRRIIENLNDEQNIKDFNKKWCSEMIDAHEKCIRSFEARLQKTSDEDLKKLINNTLPGLREHLDKIKACQEKVKNV